MNRLALVILSIGLTLVGCSPKAEVPVGASACSDMVHILPDYTEVTIPCNIAPLNFAVDGDSIDQCVAHLSFPGGELVCGHGRQVCFDPDEWHEMLKASVGLSISVEVFTHTAEGWRQHPAYSMQVAPDSIDPYVAYRLIPPYNTYEVIRLCQRNLETGVEEDFYNNQMLGTQRSGHCVNCHSFQNYRTDRMQFHVREEFAGTMIYEEGNIQKYDLKLPTTISSGVYPSWHPTRRLVAYSVNKSFLESHTNGLCKAEVQDSQSGLILFDVAHEKVIPICDEPDQFETFPSWSPDGEWLYYCNTRFAFQVADPVDVDQRIARQHEVTDRYEEIRYDICRRKFDAESLSFGPEEVVLRASADSLSATLPRISPDGRYLLTCMGRYGGFQIYHTEADLYVTDLTELDSIADHRVLDNATYPLTEANSAWAESYHNWSSNGRWIVCQSRRRDNNYTRLYFSYFDAEGHAHKAFELPQSNPEEEALRLLSYNIPEFICEPIRVSPSRWAMEIQRQEAKKTK